MNKTELITAMAEKAGLTKKDTEKALKAFEETVTETLVAGDKVQIIGFGSFEVIERKERIGRNPKTNEEMTIPGGKSPKFKPGKSMKDAIKGEE